MNAKYIYKIMQATLLLLLVSCGEIGEQNRFNTVVSPESVKSRLKLIDDRFSDRQICEDYRLFNLLIRQLHFDTSFTIHPSEECPKNFQSLAVHIIDTIKNTGDLHATTLIGYGLDATSYPVIRDCNEGCPDLVGAQLFSLPTSSQDRFYVVTSDINQKIYTYKIVGINGGSIDHILKKFIANFKVPYNKESFGYYFVDFLLKRETFDRRDKSDFSLSLQELKTGVTTHMNLSYKDKQTITAAPLIKRLNGSSNFGSSYNCKSIFNDSSENLGSCVSQVGKIVVWIKNWPQLDDSFDLFINNLLNWIGTVSEADDSLVLDLSGNPGGSPLSVAAFMCKVGNNEVLDSLENYQIKSKVWPFAFDIATKTIYTDSLINIINTDLKIIDKERTTTLDAESSTKIRSIGFLERSKITIEDCHKMRVKSIQNRNWTVLTNGREFSATEDFLFLASQSKGQFITKGMSSMGGSGAPTWLVLPNTLIRIRISPARTFYKDQAVIEKTGVAVDIPFICLDCEDSLKERVQREIDSGGEFNPSLPPLDALLKKIL